MESLRSSRHAVTMASALSRVTFSRVPQAALRWLPLKLSMGRILFFCLTPNRTLAMRSWGKVPGHGVRVSHWLSASSWVASQMAWRMSLSCSHLASGLGVDLVAAGHEARGSQHWRGHVCGPDAAWLQPPYEGETLTQFGGQPLVWVLVPVRAWCSGVALACCSWRIRAQ